MSPNPSRTDNEIRRDGGPDWTYTMTDEEQPVEAIVRCIATFTDQDPCEMTPLYETIDPDAVNVLFGSRSDRIPDSLVFYFEGKEVRVTDNEVLIRDT